MRGTLCPAAVWRRVAVLHALTAGPRSQTVGACELEAPRARGAILVRKARLKRILIDRLHGDLTPPLRDRLLLADPAREELLEGDASLDHSVRRHACLRDAEMFGQTWL